MSHARRILPLLLAALVYSSSSKAQDPGKVAPGKREVALHALSFEQNGGQTDPVVKFLSRGAGQTLFLTDNEAILALHSLSVTGFASTARARQSAETGGDGVFRLKFDGSASAAQIIGEQMLPGKTYYATTSSRQLTGNATFRRVRYTGVYPGIDVIYYFSDRQLEFDFEVAPGVDPSQIEFSLSGAQRLRLDDNGDLLFTVVGEEIRLKKPVTFQSDGGTKREIADGFVLDDDLTVRFTLGEYDNTLPLTIDPSFSFGSPDADDVLVALEADSSGNSFVLGMTYGPNNFPQTQQENGILSPLSCFLTKLDSNLSMVYSVVFEDLTSCNALTLSSTGTPYFSSALFGTSPTAQASTIVSVYDPGSLPVLINNFAVGNYDYDLSQSGLGVTAMAVNSAGRIFLLGPCRVVRPGDPPLNLNGFNAQPDQASGQLDNACAPAVNPPFVNRRQMLLTVVDSQGNFVYGSVLSPGEVTRDLPGPANFIYSLAANDAGRAFILGATIAPLMPAPNSSPYSSACSPQPACGYLMVVNTTLPGPSSLEYSSYLWNVLPSAQFVRLGSAGAVYLASDGIVSLDFPGSVPTPPYPLFPPPVSNNGGIEFSRFDLDANGAPNQLRYARLFSAAGEINASPSSTEVIRGMHILPSGAVALSTAVLDHVTTNPGGHDVIEVFFPSGQLRTPAVISPLYQSSNTPPDVAPISGDSSGNLYLARTTVQPPPAPAQADITVDLLPNADPGVNTPPALDVPADFIQLAGDPTGAQVFFQTAGFDAEDGTIFPSCDLDNGIFLPVGTRLVTCSVTDSGNLTTTKSFSVTVALNSVDVPLGDSSVQPPDLFGTPVTLNFKGVSQNGIALLTTQGSVLALPHGLKPIVPGWIYHLYTNATFATVDVCIQINMKADNLNSIRLYELIAGVWTDVTTSGYPQILSPVFNRTAYTKICGTATSLGAFEIVEPGDPNSFIETVAGNGLRGYNGDGIPATTALLGDPRSGYADVNGTLYIAESMNSRVRMIKNGIITTVAGNGTAPAFSSSIGDDGGPATSAVLNQPYAVTKDRFGNLFIAERAGCRIRRVDLTGVISTVAGSTGPCFAGLNSSGDGGPAASAVLGDLRGLAFDSLGNLFFSETFYTPNGHRIRRIDAGADGMITGAPDEIISTVVGGNGAGFSGDGGLASAAQLSNPQGIAFDRFGNLFIADEDNQRVRRVAAGPLGITGAPENIISTVAGFGPVIPNSCSPFGDDGPATQASFCFLNSVAFDLQGNLITGSYTLRRVTAVNGQIQGDPGEIIERIAGTGVFDFNGDGSALSVDLLVSDTFTDPNGNIYLLDHQLLRRYGPYITPNAAPVASNLTITGTQAAGQLLTGSYIYSDAEGDLEGTSIIRWLRDGVPISGVTGLTYTVAAADTGHAISFEVTPVAVTGISPGFSVRSAPAANLNKAPVASNVNVIGTPNVGQVLTGQYTYSDVDGDLEGASTFRWLSDGVPISGATGATYTVLFADLGHSITFEVTPVAATGTSPGTAVQSSGVTTFNGPPITHILSNPLNITNQTTASFTFSGYVPNLTFFCQLDGGAAAPCSSGVSYIVIEGSHTFSVSAVDAAGTSGPAATYPWVVDTTPPPVPNVSGPQTPGNVTNVTFNFTDTEGGITFQCSINGNSFNVCASPLAVTTPQLSTQQTFQVYAADAAGNRSSAATYNWIAYPTVPPAPVFVTHPVNPLGLIGLLGVDVITNQVAATFSWTDALTDIASYICSLDSAPATACTSPQAYTVAANSPHILQVQAIDIFGHPSPLATFKWIVDVTPPTYPMFSGNPPHMPTGPNENGTNTFILTSTDAYGIAMYLCSLDGGPFSNCNSPSTPGLGSYSVPTLPDGQHTFAAEAVDFAGNLGPVSPDTWLVDLTPPTVTPPSEITLLDSDTKGIQKYLSSATATDNSSFNANPIGTAVNSHHNFADPPSPCPENPPSIRNPFSSYSAQLLDGINCVEFGFVDVVSNIGLGYSRANVIPGTFTPTGGPVASTTTVVPINGRLGQPGTPSNVTVTFYGVSGAGETGVDITPDGPAQLPANFKLGDPAQYYQVITTAQLNNPVQVQICIMPNRLVPGSAVLSYNKQTKQWENFTIQPVPANGPVCMSNAFDNSLEDTTGSLRISLAFVTPLNNPPYATNVLVAGTPGVFQNLTGQYTYNDTESDPEGISTYQWLRDGVPVGLGGPGGGPHGNTYTASFLDLGHAIQFEVTPVAATGASPGTPVQSPPVTIVNSAPLASGQNITGAPRANSVLAGQYTYFDADNDPEGVSTFRWLRDGVAISGAVRTTYTVLPADLGHFITFEVTPIAAAGVRSGVPVQTAALQIVDPPAITSANITTLTVGAAGSFTVLATGTPSPTFSVTGALPSGVLLNSTTGVLSGTPAVGTGGVYTVSLTATNHVAPDTTQTFTLTINEAPSFTSAPNAIFTAGFMGTFKATTLGFPHPVLSSSPLPPAGVTFVDNHDGTATLSGSPATGTAPNTPYTMTFIATIGSTPPQTATQSFSLSVDQAPTINSANIATFTVGTPGSFTIMATGNPTPALSLASALPPGITFNASTGVLSGTPTAGSGGIYPLTLKATNGIPPDASQVFTLTVKEAPAITSANNATFTVGVAGSFTVATTGFPSAAVTESGTLPSGITYNPATHVLSGTPAAGTARLTPYTISFTASNGVGANSVQTFNLTVNQAPAITSAAGALFTVGIRGSFTVTVTGTPTPTRSISGDPLPTGVTFTPSNGVLSGTPLAGAVGTYNLVFTASNGVGANAIQNFTLTIQNPAAPAFTSASSTTFTTGIPGTFTVSASGSPVPTLSRTSGALPGGVTFNAATGALSGTPAANSGGVYNLQFTASSAVLPAAVQNFTLTVNQPLAITTATTSTFIVGTAKSFTVRATGFPIPALSASGNLPGGVTFVDNLNGTATLGGTAVAGAGNYNISITASNGVGANATQNFALIVDQGAAITSASSAALTVGTAGSFTVTATGFPVPTLTNSGALPTGMTFTDNHNGTGTLAGTPAVGSGKMYNLTFTARSTGTPNATQSFALTVNESPAITTAASTMFMVGTAKSFTLRTRGFPFPAIATSSTLPTGITLVDNHDGTATLSGTAAAGTGGVYTLALGASNGIGSGAIQNFALTINQAPAITSLASATFRTGVASSFTVTTTGFPAPTLTASGTLPRGVTFRNNGNGNATLSGTPASGTAGTYSITLTARNATGTNATQAFTLTVQ